jgi:hypothetical protein
MTSLLAFLGAGLISLSALGASQDDFGAPKVQVAEKEGKWLISGRKNRVELNPADLQMTIEAAGRRWVTAASSAGDLAVETGGTSCSLRLADAAERTVAPYETGFQTGVKVALRGFRRGEVKIDLSLDLFACLEGEREELVCALVAHEDGAQVLECFWPPALADSSFDATVIPFMQGMLLPKNWARKVWLYDTMCYGRGLYMPWWGHQQGPASMLVLIETPDDAGCRFEHPAGGPTRIGLRWVHSLGRLQYPRRGREAHRLTRYPHGHPVAHPARVAVLQQR